VFGKLLNTAYELGSILVASIHLIIPKTVRRTYTVFPYTVLVSHRIFPVRVTGHSESCIYARLPLCIALR